MPIKRNRAEMEHFHDFLREKGLKKTYQKDLILETFLNMEGHLSVEDVYTRVKKKDKKVGLVTVFRTLNSLKKCGIAREISLGEGKPGDKKPGDRLKRFEHCYQHPYHHHIICKDCNKTIEFVSPELESIQDEIIRKYDFKSDYHHVQIKIYGSCRDCVENRTATSTEEHDTEKIFARDALNIAKTMAESCLKFYQNSAWQNQNHEGREVFERLVVEEKKHILELESELNKVHQQEKNLEQAPLFLHFDADELKSMFPDLSEYQTGGELQINAEAASRLSYKLNLKSSEFFKKYAEKFTDTLGKRIFMNFAIQEEKHNDLVKQRIEDHLQTSVH